MDNYNIKYRISEWTKKDLLNNEKINFLNELKNSKFKFKKGKLIIL